MTLCELVISTLFSSDAIVLCSYQFVRARSRICNQTPWDLVVIDETHRLRNVYKASSKIANAIKQAVAPFPEGAVDRYATPELASGTLWPGEASLMTMPLGI